MHIKGLNLTGLLTVVDEIHGVTISGISNFAYIMKGVSIAGLRNRATYARGIQIGLFNKATEMRGFQFGLWNTNGRRSLPIINWQFKSRRKKWLLSFTCLFGKFKKSDFEWILCTSSNKSIIFVFQGTVLIKKQAKQLGHFTLFEYAEIDLQNNFKIIAQIYE